MIEALHLYERACLTQRREERVKLPLQRLGQDLLDMVRTGSCQADQLALALNQGALLLSQVGHWDKAAALCNRSIEVFCGSAATGDAAHPRLLIQPYINLGRIESARGLLAAALLRFDTAGAIAQGLPVSVAGVRMDQHFEDDAGVRSSCAAAAIFDSLKALLQSADWPRLVDFASRLTAGPEVLRTPSALLGAEEAQARALLELGRVNEALRLLARMRDEMAQTQRRSPATLLLIAEAYRRSGHSGLADGALRAAASAATWARAAAPQALAQRRQLEYLVALEAWSQRQIEISQEHGRAALDLCDELGDEAGTIKCLSLQLLLARGGPDAPAAAARLEDLASRSLYRTETGLAWWILYQARSNPAQSRRCLANSWAAFEHQGLAQWRPLLEEIRAAAVKAGLPPAPPPAVPELADRAYDALMGARIARSTPAA